MNTELLSVCLITYNHEKFVAQAIESILMQKTNFDFNVVIADDYSTDETRRIILNYQECYPSKIKLIFQEKNVGPAQNFIDLISSPISKYIAYLEGDDYWIDPYKLQNQVDILENNPDCVLCFTDKQNLTPNGTLVHKNTIGVPTKSKFSDLLVQNYIPTVTIVYRNFSDDLPNWYEELKFGDWPLYLWLLKDGGLAFYLKQSTAVYREGVGISAQLREREYQTSVEILKMLTLFDGLLRKPTIKLAINKKKYEIAYSLVRQMNFMKAVRFCSNHAPDEKFLFLKVVTDVLKTQSRKKIVFLAKSLQAYYCLFLFVIKDRKKIQQSDLVFFFPFYHTGGAERVHASIVHANRERRCTVIFTKGSATSSMLYEFKKTPTLLN